MKEIDTLADDIKGLLGSAKGDGTFEEAVLAKFGAATAMHVADSVRERSGVRKPNTLYMSEVGQPCKRKLWYSIHYPELGEQMQGHTLFKFLYGDIIEETALLLAEAAGHYIEKRQSRVTYIFDGWTIAGKQDAVIDGVLVDIKSVSPFGFKKMKEGLTDDNDSFGYRVQLSGYNGLLTPTYTQQGFLAIDKQNGHVGYFESPYVPVLPAIAEAVRAVKSLEEPKRKFDLVPLGAGGNMKLGVECSYCPFKQVCWRDANKGKGLRAFHYSTGPVFLGTVEWVPRVPEMILPPLPGYADLFPELPLVAAKITTTEATMDEEGTTEGSVA